MSEISKRLREERERVGISLDEIARYTKIPIKYLHALENDQFHTLPSSAHAKAYLGKYIDLLGLPRKQLLALYKAEQYEFEAVVPHTPISVFKKISKNTIVFTTSQGVIIIAAFLSFLLLFYIYAQLHTLLASPTLILTSPAEGENITEPFVTVEGKTESDSILFINGQKIDVESSGDFREKIALSNEHSQQIIVTAENKISKAKTEIRRGIISKTSEPSLNSLLESPVPTSLSSVKLQIRVTQDVTITVTKDGIRKPEILVKNTVTQLYADTKISITSNKPQYIYVKYNDGPEERMGTSGTVTKEWPKPK
ncbi:MAG: helix-turn-helix domain-containing protein [bacterium]